MKDSPGVAAGLIEDDACRRAPAFPTFVVIGAMKSGTHSFHYFLGKHPQIFMSAIKGPALFIDLDEPIRYPSDYRSIAEQRRYRSDVELLSAMKTGYRDQAHFGESTTLYTRYPTIGAGAPKKMLRCNPNLKLIYLLRNPIDRIVSQFRYELGKPHNAPNGCFDEYLRTSDAIATSKYFVQLCRYLDSGFVREQVQLILFEELLSSPGATLAAVTRFLEVDDCGSWDLPHLNRTRWYGGRRDSRLSRLHWHSLYRELLPQVQALEEFLGRRVSAWDLSEKVWT
jgi:hypothetical protein